MTTFLPQKVKLTEHELSSAFSQLLGSQVTDLERLGGGRNSQVYRLNGSDGRTYAGKVYFRHTQDSRDRLAVEFGALSFLTENGIDFVPQPLAAHRERGLAVYEHINGKKIWPDGISRDDLNEAVIFLVRLKELRMCTGTDQLQPASEACFSVAEVVENLKQRLTRLRGLKRESKSYLDMNFFLEYELVPALEKIINWVQLRLDFDAELSWGERTLSPSDFGFHNALRMDSGQIVWLDFEYFGWDDPAKMVADFLLHPAMALDHAAGHEFVQGILAGFREIENLSWRLESVYPLFGLKWCLIMLNEFLPTDLLRRRFANQKEINMSKTQSRQLAKARRMLERIVDEYKSFPYS